MYIQKAIYSFSQIRSGLQSDSALSFCVFFIIIIVIIVMFLLGTFQQGVHTTMINEFWIDGIDW